MATLRLNVSENASLEAALEKMEALFGSEYSFEPEMSEFLADALVLHSLVLGTNISCYVITECSYFTEKQTLRPRWLLQCTGKNSVTAQHWGHFLI